MKTTILLTQLLLNIETLQAFSPSLQRSTLTRQSQPSSTRVFSQWDDEEEEILQKSTFDEAGVALTDEEEQKRIAEMGDDTNEDYSTDDISRVREAIRQRTEALGMERSKVSVEAIQAAQERAKSAVENNLSGASQLDLSQITENAPRGEDADNIPAMFYDPETEMTKEEMIEADPDSQLNFYDQVMKEITSSTWPSPGAALKEVFVLIFVGAASTALIINWDNFLRETYTNFGMIPTEEQIMQGSENMVLPDGWTNGMSEDDFMNFREEQGKSSSPSVEAIKQGFPEL
ncbi:unnamed protein product [Cylindrotheca closterium]|uniref:Uncharacterized protein n=1 Tax=Cylindrotheca closterium TaxID=2856 RepID=A0AAD2FW18_9STRA|nr:unnamed protein product [Cylindrotheca closterium]